MKSFFLALVASLPGFSLVAQTRPVFTLPELMQLATCADHTCFRKAVRARGYEFFLTEKHALPESTIRTHFYHVLTESGEPRWREYIVAFTDGGTLLRKVYFLTHSSTYPAQLENELARQGFNLTGPDNPDGDRTYVLDENGLRWTLKRDKPSFNASRGRAKYTISLSSEPKQSTQPATPVAQTEATNSDREASRPESLPTSLPRSTQGADPAAATRMAPASEGPEVFEEFLQRISADRAFQRERVFDMSQPTITWGKVSRRTGQRTDVRITPPAWKHLDFRRNPDDPARPAEWIVQSPERFNQGRTVILSGVGNELYVEFHFAYTFAQMDKVTGRQYPERWILSTITETIP